MIIKKIVNNIIFNKSCANCVFYIKKTDKIDLHINQCSRFSIKLEDNTSVNIFSFMARDNRNLCGRDGIYFKNK